VTTEEALRHLHAILGHKQIYPPMMPGVQEMMEQEVAKLIARSEDSGGERACSPNGFGLCSTHPACEYMTATLQEYQDATMSAQRRVVKPEKALRYAADCSTLEMVRDTARGMGVIE